MPGKKISGHALIYDIALYRWVPKKCGVEGVNVINADNSRENAMTPRQAVARFRELRHEDDAQGLRNAADAILLQFLIELGYGEVAEAFIEHVYCRESTRLRLH